MQLVTELRAGQWKHKTRLMEENSLQVKEEDIILTVLFYFNQVALKSVDSLLSELTNPNSNKLSTKMKESVFISLLQRCFFLFVPFERATFMRT